MWGLILDVNKLNDSGVWENLELYSGKRRKNEIPKATVWLHGIYPR